MRKLIYGINLSLDGCCDHTRFGGSEGIHDYFRALFEVADTVIYGRKTYELMVPFWPCVAEAQNMGEAENAFARAFDALQKVVVSSTLGKLTDPKTQVINGDVKSEIERLKRLPGRAISTGGVEFPSQLAAWGLIDDFHIVVHPQIAGAGKRLFTDLHLPHAEGLRLISSTAMSSGCVALHYSKMEQ